MSGMGGGYSASASSSASTGPASSGFGASGGLFIQGIVTGGSAGQAASGVPGDTAGGIPSYVYMAAIAVLAVLLLRRR